MTGEEKEETTPCTCPYCDSELELKEDNPPFCRPCQVVIVTCPACGGPVREGGGTCPSCGASTG